jgi:hypothetical protein
MERLGYFTVEVMGRGRFRILPTTPFNVMHVETGSQYCVVTESKVPLWDLMLSQKLFLESDATGFFTVANLRVPQPLQGGTQPPWESVPYPRLP